MARKAAPARAHEPETSSPPRGVPIPAGTLVRRWSDEELRLPMWLRGSTLPSHIVEYSKQLYIDGEWPVPHVHLIALIGLARGAELGILRVREEHAVSPDSADPKTVVHNVLAGFRFGRDELLRQIQPTYVGLVGERLDRLIDATKTTLDAYMAEALDRIRCDNPDCPIRGHLLPGPWVDAIEQSEGAFQDAYGLVTFLNDSTTEDMQGDTDANLPPNPNPRNCPSVLTESQRNVLQFLFTQSVTRPRTYIADNANAGLESVGNDVKALAKLGLVTDHGRNKGVAISREGREWLKWADNQ